MTEKGEVDLSRFARQVEEIGKLLNSGVRERSGYSLAALLESAEGRVDALRAEDAHGTLEKREREAKQTAAVVMMVEREHNLNAAEKEQYGRFLEQDYFTKATFPELDRFYEKSWDKLSDEGKAQMSHRVWEGIRRDEYEFDELPETVRKKEAERLFQQLTGKVEADAGLQNIPEQDKADFIREYKAGSDQGVSEVLKRAVYSENVSSRKEASQKDASSQQIEPERKEPEPEKKPADQKDTGGDFLALKGITFGESDKVTRPDVSAAGTGQSHSKG